MSYCCEVRAPKAAAPALLSLSVTAHWLLVADSSAVALLIWVPCTLATSRAYLLPLLSHETICVPGLSYSSAVVYPTWSFQVLVLSGVQTSLRNSASVCWFTRRTSP